MHTASHKFLPAINSLEFRTITSNVTESWKTVSNHTFIFITVT